LIYGVDDAIVVVVGDQLIMHIPDNDRLANSELRTFLDGLFPHGVDLCARSAPTRSSFRHYSEELLAGG
jgi:hypothetical protein